MPYKEIKIKKKNNYIKKNKEISIRKNIEEQAIKNEENGNLKIEALIGLIERLVSYNPISPDKAIEFFTSKLTTLPSTAIASSSSSTTTMSCIPDINDTSERKTKTTLFEPLKTNPKSQKRRRPLT